MVILIVSVLTALGVSALCSLMEAVLLSLTPGDIAELSKNYPKIGKIWSQFKKNIEKPIAVVLILNTTAHTIGAAVAGAAFGNMFGSTWIWLFSLLFTFLMLQYTEILPKTVGVRFNRRLARFFARPLLYATGVLSPIIRLTYFFNRPFEPAKDKQKQEQRSTVDEINLMAALARQHHLIGLQQEQIILGATRLSGMKVESVMLPIDDAVLLSDSMSLLDAIEIAHTDAHTRFPVCRGTDRNDIIGYVNFKEIIGHQRLNPRATTFSDIVRTISFVDPNCPASELLRMFIMHHEHIAIVRNNDNICLGLVTLEDVVEELVGEIEDEFDRLPQYIHWVANEGLLMGGGCTIKKVAEVIKNHFKIDNLNFSEDEVIYKPQPIQSTKKTIINEPEQTVEQSEPKTLASWMKEKAGKTLNRGDRIIYRGLVFTVRRLRRQLVFDVQIQRD